METSTLSLSEIKSKLKQSIEKCKSNPYFLYNPKVEIDDIPSIIEEMYSISGLLYAIPQGAESYHERLCSVGYICTYKDCPVPKDIIPLYKDPRTGEDYAYNISYNAYGMFIRDFTHDLNASLYAFKEFYNRYKEDSYSYPKEFIYAYATYLQPFLCTVVNCTEHLLNNDEYEGEPFFYSKYNRKEGVYKTYYFTLSHVIWEGKKVYVYNIPILNKNQIKQKFVLKTRNTFERVKE